MGFWKSLASRAQAVTDDFGQTIVNTTDGAFGGTTTEERAQRRAAEEQAQISAKSAAQLQAEAAAKAEAERQTEAQRIASGFAMTDAQTRVMEAARKRSEGEDLMSAQMAAKQQRESEQQMRALAYARGYNPMTARSVEYAGAASKAGIQAQALQAAEQEKAAGLADYQAMLSYQQQMLLAGEQAKKAFLMGDQELRLQQEASLQNYRSALSEIETRRKMADAQRRAQLTGALIGAAGTVGGTLIGGPAGAAIGGTIASQR